jgi:hypothetical protein
VTTFDLLAPSFRRASLRWPGAQNLQTRIDDLSQAYGVESDSILEKCKSVIETIGRTLLAEMGEPGPANTDVTGHVVAALNALGVSNTRGASQFDKVLSAHNRLGDAINDVRNTEGVVAHGKDGFMDRMTAYHARTYLLASDTIISLLMEVYDGRDPNIRYTRDEHSRFKHLNEKINSAVSVQATTDENDGTVILAVRGGTSGDGFTLRFPPSQLLFDLDREAYADILDNLYEQDTPEDDKEEADEDDAGPAVEAQPAVALAEDDQPVVEPAEETPDAAEIDFRSLAVPRDNYGGLLKGDIGPLYEFLTHELGATEHLSAEEVLRLSHSFLWGFEFLAVIDWRTRTASNSKMLIFVRRTLQAFDFGPGKIVEVAPRITRWFAENLRGPKA